jgi:hypothetical protein
MLGWSQGMSSVLDGDALSKSWNVDDQRNNRGDNTLSVVEQGRLVGYSYTLSICIIVKPDARFVNMYRALNLQTR